MKEWIVEKGDGWNWKEKSCKQMRAEVTKGKFLIENWLGFVMSPAFQWKMQLKSSKCIQVNDRFDSWKKFIIIPSIPPMIRRV